LGVVSEWVRGHLVVVVGPVAAALRGAVRGGGIGHVRASHVKGLDVRSG
jgi:hypothetical protein